VVVSKTAIAIVGAGPYGLSLAAHLAARNIEHRIIGHPMHFWSQIAQAGGERYLKSYCFGTNISTPNPRFSFADYSAPRGLEIFEPCSIADFAAYGVWFQTKNIPWVELVEVEHVAKTAQGFSVSLTDGTNFIASQLVLATGLSYFAYVPPVLSPLPRALVTHTSMITSFAAYKDKSVAVVGGGQSALEAAALLREAGAWPQLLVRDHKVRWNRRVSRERSVWERVRWPISGLGTGPKAWVLTHAPGATHRMPAYWRTRFVRNHLPPEGAWWLRDRVENHVPIHLGSTVVEAREKNGRLVLSIAQSGKEQCMIVDHVVAGSGYDIDIQRIAYLDPKLRKTVNCGARAPKLNSRFESSVAGLRFIGPASAMSFGPLFRFVVGAEYTARMVSGHLTSQLSRRG
jgi:cation diffusion facilitator CzcD-associated flavoprotein CzcO